MVSDQRLTALIPADVEVSSVQLIPELPESIDAPVKKGDKIGTVTLVLAGEELGKADLVANDSVEMSKILYYYDQAMILLGGFWAKFALIFVVLSIISYTTLMIVMNKHSRKRRMNQKRRKNL